MERRMIKEAEPEIEEIKQAEEAKIPEAEPK